jgi:hypothetical protein
MVDLLQRQVRRPEGERCQLRCLRRRVRRADIGLLQRQLHEPEDRQE